MIYKREKREENRAQNIPKVDKNVLLSYVYI